MHTVILVSIIGTLALLMFRFYSGAELICFFIFLVCTIVVLVSLISLGEYKLALFPAAALSAAVIRMWQSYKRFQE
ncbi:hypothetical protein [Salinimicrobium sp. WS361]|uniref:hypothetical protein n=1 Tax=Salinimicrobium sp. WS361 TaxID=3425123 RepID=UPI003D6EB59C